MRLPALTRSPGSGWFTQILQLVFEGGNWKPRRSVCVLTAGDLYRSIALGACVSFK